MRWRNQYRLPLALVIVVVWGPTLGWSADTFASAPSNDARQADEARAGQTGPASGVVPASFSSMSDWRDSLMDGGESITRPDLHKNCFLFRTSCLGRSHQRTVDHVRADREKYQAWHYYISGHGPAIWVRN